MAVAMKCDRCGKFFMEEDFGDKPVLHVEEYMKETPGKFGYWKGRDLCPSCLEALDHFMKCEPIEMKFEFSPDGFRFINDYSVKCGGKHCHEIDKNI